MDEFFDSWSESQLEAFERAWLKETPPSILDWIAKIDSHLDDHKVRQALATELSLLDLEYRWRQKAAHKTRTAGWYRVALELDEGAIVKLAEHEMRVRTCWGDVPTIEAVTADLPKPHSIKLHLHRFLQQRFPLRATIVNTGSQLRLEAPVLGETIIGRQRSREAAPMNFSIRDTLDAVPRSRIIIADDRDSSVSRRQVTLNRRSAETLELHAAARGSQVLVNGTPCKPGRGTMIGLGEKITVGRVQITIESMW